MPNAADFPENHPVKLIFRTFAERGLAQAQLEDKDILLYLADLLVDFIYVENFYRTRGEDGSRLASLADVIRQAGDSEMPERKQFYKHLGDYSLFMLGMFPEYLNRRRRALSPSWYEDMGRIGYQVAGELERHAERIMVFRKLAARFDRCVISLQWVREYSTDPFYQFMLRQFEIT